MSNIIASIIDYTKNIWHNTDQDIVMAEHINAWENSIENMSNFLARYAWHPNTAYPKGSVILFPFGLNTKLVSQNAGTSGYVEPTWSDASGTPGNRAINDNGIIWAEKPMEISSDTTPIGTIKQQLWHTAPPGYLKLDASVLLSRNEYPELWEFVQKYAPLISETAWQTQKAKQNTVAYFSTGDGSTNFRTPVILDFARGGSVTSVGTYTTDQNKAHNHPASITTKAAQGSFYTWKTHPYASGVFSSVFVDYGANSKNGGSDPRYRVDFNLLNAIESINIGNSGSNEAMPRNFIMPYFLRTLNV